MTVREPGAVLGCMVLAAGVATLHAQASRSVWDGVFTAEQAVRGAALYATHCASCHGENLGGAEMAPALTGLDFHSSWNGLTLGDLYERLRSMPQENPGKINAQQRVDILAHMLRAGGFPSGQMELVRDAQALGQVRYEFPRR